MIQIPSPVKIKDNQFRSAAGLAFVMKQALVDGLYRGSRSVDWPDVVGRDTKEAIITLLEKEFEDAGWILLDHGTFISLRPK